MAICSAQEMPAKWVSWHRRHHQFSDEQEDPHSPLVTFFWSHIGWLIYDNRDMHTAASYHKYARDILDAPFYMYLEKSRFAASFHYLLHAVAFFVAGLAVGWLREGQWLAGLQFGLSLMVWGVILRTVYVWHITWAARTHAKPLGHFGHRRARGQCFCNAPISQRERRQPGPKVDPRNGNVGRPSPSVFDHELLPSTSVIQLKQAVDSRGSLGRAVHRQAENLFSATSGKAGKISDHQGEHRELRRAM